MEKEISQHEVHELAMNAFGVVPGIVKEIAARSTRVAYLFTLGSAVLEKGSFSFKELNVIELKISALNNCTSCIKGHTYLLKKEGMADEDVRAIVEKRHLSEERLNLIIKATEDIYYAGSNVFPDHVAQGLVDNFSETEITEIIGLIGVKTIANYTNNYLAALKFKNY